MDAQMGGLCAAPCCPAEPTSRCRCPQHQSEGGGRHSLCSLQPPLLCRGGSTALKLARGGLAGRKPQALRWLEVLTLPPPPPCALPLGPGLRRQAAPAVTRQHATRAQMRLWQQVDVQGGAGFKNELISWHACNARECAWHACHRAPAGNRHTAPARPPCQQQPDRCHVTAPLARPAAAAEPSAVVLRLPRSLCRGCTACLGPGPLEGRR